VTADARETVPLLDCFGDGEALMTRRLENTRDREVCRQTLLSTAGYVEARKRCAGVLKTQDSFHLKHKYDETKETYRQNTQATLREAATRPCRRWTLLRASTFDTIDTATSTLPALVCVPSLA
jgi:hypothetical protein